MKMKLKLCAAILAASVTGAANAGLVTEWTYVNQAGFSAWSAEATAGEDSLGNDQAMNSAGGSGTDLEDDAGNIIDTDLNGMINGDDDALNTSLAWGTPANFSSDPRSSMHIDSPVEGTIVTGDTDYVDGTDITHENWIIIGDSLTSATVLDALALQPTAYNTYGSDEDDLLDNAPYFAPQLQFGINFLETPNGDPENDGCPDGNAHGVGDNINGCGDIFEITGLEAIPFLPVVGDDFIEFTVPFVLTDKNTGLPLAGWGDVVYLVTTRLSGLSTLSDNYTCANGAPTCYGFVTVEEQQNVLSAQFKIQAVPEPSTLAIFGLGMIGFGLARRKKS